MSLIKNLKVFRNWPLFYAARYGLLRREFEMVHRNGIRLRLRPDTDDLKIVKSNWVTRHYIRDFVPLTKDSVVVDVGAHIGAFSVMAATVASQVLSFEPEPGNFEMLRRNVELNSLRNISLFEAAVSGTSGDRSLVVYGEGSTGTHSLYRPDEGGGERMEKRVKTVSIEQIMEREDLSRIDFLKLDCEGAEHDIFRKLKEDTASKIMHIAMETHVVKEGISLDLPARLQELGFEVRMESNGGYVYARRVEAARPQGGASRQ